MMRRLITFIIIAIATMTCAMATHAARFSWGADVGSSIDLGGHDMSTINLDAYFGYHDAVVDMAGVGAGINMMVSNGCRTFPLFAILRTSFRAEPSLCFMDLRAGCAVDNLYDNSTQTVLMLNPSVGFNLARGKNFTSYLTFGYLYNGMRSFGPDDNRIDVKGGLNMFNVRLGISF